MTLSDLEIRLVEVILTALGAAITGLIGVWIAKLMAGVRREYGNLAADKSQEYMDIMADVAMHAVVSLKQSVVDQLKASGGWNAEAAKLVKADAVSSAVAALGALRTRIESQLLIDVPKFMENLIEVQLRNVKETEPAPQTVTLPAGNSSAIPGGETETAPPGNQP